MTTAEDSAWNEPEILINGRLLTTAQAMTIRLRARAWYPARKTD